MPELGEFLKFGPTIVMLLLFLVGALKFAPYWKEVRLEELKVRSSEAVSRQKQAEGLIGLSQVIERVADAQQQTAENNEELRIFLRAAMREHEGFSKRLSAVEQVVVKIKGSGNEDD
jgi:hypothetical protein